MKTAVALGLLAVAPYVSAVAADTTPSQLRAVAERAVRAQYEQAGSRVVILPTALNPRLRLAGCAAPLQAHLPSRQGVPSQVAVTVSCPDAARWSIQVPVRLQVFRRVLVTTRPLARGDIPGPGDVHAEERDVTRLGYGYVQNLQQIAGHAMQRPLIAGVVLTPGDLAGRVTVRAGDEVALVADLGAIEVRTSAMALGSGDTGAHLKVRNMNSGRVIDAVVLSAGEVRALP